MTLPYLKGGINEGEEDYLIASISFERDVVSGEFIGAYIGLEHNFYHGNHKELAHLSLDLNSAFNKVFERIE